MPTIDEAIKILEERKKGRESIGQFDDVKAIQLGIAALKRIKANRADFLPFAFHALPGETKELRGVR